MWKIILVFLLPFIFLPPIVLATDSTQPNITPPTPSVQTKESYVNYSDTDCTSPSQSATLNLSSASGSGDWVNGYINPGGCPDGYAMTNVAVDPSIYGWWLGTAWLHTRGFYQLVTIRCCKVKHRWVTQGP